MKLELLTVLLVGVSAFAAPISKASANSKAEAIAYPDERLYAEEYKRSDEDIAYPDEQLYAEEYKQKRAAAENIAYPDEQLYAEEY